MSNQTVRFFNAAFDEREGDIILRGSIDPESLQKLCVDGYQREILPRKGSLTYWTEQLRRGFIPDVDLGMRGGGGYFIMNVSPSTAAEDSLNNGEGRRQ